MASRFTPGGPGKLREQQARREAEQAKAAGDVRLTDVHLLTKLLRVLHVAERRPLSRLHEGSAWRSIHRVQQRLEEVAAVCADNDPIQALVEEWCRFYRLDQPEKDRPYIGDLRKNRVRAAIELANRTQSLLQSKCPEEVDDAASKRQADLDRLTQLAALLNRAVRLPLDSNREKQIRTLVLATRRRLRELDRAEGNASGVKDLLSRWDDLYRIKSNHGGVSIRELVRDVKHVALALTLVQETKEFLDPGAPTGRKAPSCRAQPSR